MLNLLCQSVLRYRLGVYVVALIVIMFAWSNRYGQMVARAQNNPADIAGPSSDAAPAATNEPAPVDPNATPKDPGINIFDLAMQGGFFMYPLYALSLLAVGVCVERALALRKDRIVPSGLIGALGQLGQAKGGFDPRKAYRICQEHPSATANVIKAMLLKVGRPHSEVEHTVIETSDREANRLYSNVRLLNLTAATAPLIGLLGTVQGMIIAFHQMTLLAANVNKATVLAGGIYTALVTTFAGLVVAIPSVIAAHFFESRIQELFHDIDELLFNLLPQVERFEGRVRFSSGVADGSFTTEPEEPVSTPPVQRAVAK